MYCDLCSPPTSPLHRFALARCHVIFTLVLPPRSVTTSSCLRLRVLYLYACAQPCTHYGHSKPTMSRCRSSTSRGFHYGCRLLVQVPATAAALGSRRLLGIFCGARNIRAENPGFSEGTCVYRCTALALLLLSTASLRALADFARCLTHIYTPDQACAVSPPGAMSILELRLASAGRMALPLDTNPPVHMTESSAKSDLALSHSGVDPGAE